MLFVPASAVFAVLARAQAPSFEARLQAVREAVVGSLEERRYGVIEEATRQTQTLDGVVGQERWVVQDIRRRTAWIDPARGRDWFFEADVRKVRHDLQDLAFRTKSLESTVTRLARETAADPSLAPAAARLLTAARGLRVESGRLADDGRWADHELRRAGYQAEGADVSRSAAAVLMSAFHIEDAAQRLQRRTKP